VGEEVETYSESSRSQRGKASGNNATWPHYYANRTE